MPKDKATNRFGVSLSGGGYRASAFHIGTLRALNKLKLLSRIDVLSTISGGSITGAAYCLHEGSWEEFEDYMIEKVSSKSVIKFVLTSRAGWQLLLFTMTFLGTGVYFLFFSSIPWLFLVFLALWIFLLLKFQFYIFPTGREVERAYDKFYYHGATLDKLCKKPELAIGSSNLQTGRPFTFSWRRMSDSTYSFMDPPIYFKQEEFPVARAVMASSCVPFAFTPISIKKKFYKNQIDYYRIEPKLIDGGVYDNQGIQKITQPGSSFECDIIITSDAGGKLSFQNKYGNTLTLLIRTVDLFMNRIKLFQMAQNIYENADGKQIAYLSLGWDIQNCIPGFWDNMCKGHVIKSVIDAHGFDPQWVNDPKNFQSQIEDHLKLTIGYREIEARNLSPDELACIRDTGTNLTPLSKNRIRLLARHAENLTELQVKLYCPSLIKGM